MPIDEWTRVAAADDALVADLLLGLKHSGEIWMRTTKKVAKSDSISGGLATFRWGRRKARSRHGVTRFGLDKEYTKRATRSPTTPLSWSGGTSVSADGYEASSMMCNRSPTSRSKNYMELKQEEGSLLQEKQILRRDMVNMHLKMAHHRNINKNLKKIERVNLHSKMMSTSLFTRHDTILDIPLQPQASISFDDVPVAKGNGESFMIPDLNMLPSIDEEPF